VQPRAWLDVTTVLHEVIEMMGDLLQLETILKTELEYAISRWGRNLHVSEMELALRIVQNMIKNLPYVPQSV